MTSQVQDASTQTESQDTSTQTTPTISWYLNSNRPVLLVVHDEEIPQELLEKYSFKPTDKSEQRFFETKKKVFVPRAELWSFLLDNKPAPSILDGTSSDIKVSQDQLSGCLQNSIKEKTKEDEKCSCQKYANPETFYSKALECITLTMKLFPTDQVIELGAKDGDGILKIGVEGKKSFASISRCYNSRLFTSFNAVPLALQPFVLQMSGLQSSLCDSEDKIWFVSKVFDHENERIYLMWESKNECNVFSPDKITNDDCLNVLANGKPLTCFMHNTV